MKLSFVDSDKVSMYFIVFSCLSTLAYGNNIASNVSLKISLISPRSKLLTQQLNNRNATYFYLPVGHTHFPGMAKSNEPDNLSQTLNKISDNYHTMSSATTLINLHQSLGQNLRQSPESTIFVNPMKRLSENGGDPFGDNYRVDLDPDHTAHFPIDVKDCSKDDVIHIKASSGIVYLVDEFNSSVLEMQLKCNWEVRVSPGYFLAARLQPISERCIEIIVSVQPIGETFYCKDHKLIYLPGNSAKFEIEKGVSPNTNITRFWLFFTTLSHDGRHILPVVMTSSTTGHVTSAGFGVRALYSPSTIATYDLVVPPDHIVMISFPRANFGTYESLCLSPASDKWRRPLTCILVTGKDGGYTYRQFNTSIFLRFDGTGGRGYGFQMDFSFHLVSDAPVNYDNGSLDCSRSNYNTFKQHVRCDFARDCVGGEDEDGHCPFSNQLCNGRVALGNKCYMPYQNKRRMSWVDANEACKARGGVLASLRTTEETEAVKKIFEYSKVWSPAFVGLRQVDSSLPHMYWKMWMWSNDVVAYDFSVNTYNRFGNYVGPLCGYIERERPAFIIMIGCENKRMIFPQRICEFATENGIKVPSDSTYKTQISDLSQKSNVWADYQIIKCPSGHVTFSFLSCEPASDCGSRRHQASCTTLYQFDPDVADPRMVSAENKNSAPSNMGPSSSGRPLSAQDVSGKHLVAVTVAMFACADSEVTLPYSLVCDYVQHCPSGFDETFCGHGDACHDLTCSSGQCFTYTQKCNNVYDCLDRSDELDCPPKTNDDFFGGFMNIQKVPHSIVDFDGKGDFTQRSLTKSNSCPETHFRCLEEESHCLPVYVLCNEVYDCPDREDEEACDRYTCPGFYRCRGSRICVHADHMCDGWPQCTQSDDELYCNLTCPPGCMCQGLAAVCSVKFPAHDYNNTLYFDARGSKMKLADFFHNTYLVWLSLASCDIDQVYNLTWPNLIYLDLSHNDLHAVNMSSFLQLPNLRTLVLADNPLVTFEGDTVCSINSQLKQLDLSETMVQEFDSKVLSCFPQINELNISHCPLVTVTDNGFRSTPYLTHIDLSGSPVSQYPRDVFKELAYLKQLYADNFKLCCKTALPTMFNEKFCFAPQDEISSCDDLLKSNLFRGCLWVFAGLAVIGNITCLFIRLSSTGQNSKSGFNMFVTNLTVADSLMGVYLVIVGVADMVYRGQYMWYDTTWKSSTACAVAGFLSLLSSEMSAFMIFFITLDRFIVLTFPFSDLRFKGRSAAVTCGLLWTLGVLLASVPLLPMKPRWEFFGHTGICIPLPITRGNFHGQDYAFGIMIILNFSLFVLITVGQVSIYWSVRVNSMVSDNSRKSKDLVIARRLFTVAASDFLCWFPIGLMGLLSSNDVPVSSTVSVAMAIFVLPLNSALNPFLYTFNVVMEKRRKLREAQLMKFLEARILSQKT